MSALPSKADMLSIGIDVRVVPIRHSQAEHKQDRTAHYPPQKQARSLNNYRAKRWRREAEWAADLRY